jgi:hypothetical protein
MKIRRSLFSFVPALLVILSVSVGFAQSFGVKKKPTKPHQFGNVVMNKLLGTK